MIVLIVYLSRWIVEVGSGLFQIALGVVMRNSLIHIPLGTEVEVLYQGNRVIARGMQVDGGWMVTINRRSVFIPNDRVISGTTEDPTL